MLGTGDARRSRAVKHDADVANIFANDFQSIQQRRPGNDRAAVLIVVKRKVLALLMHLCR